MLSALPVASGPRQERRAAGPARGEVGPDGGGADLTGRVRHLDRTLRHRLRRRDTVLDLVHAVHGSLEPQDIAQAVVDRAAVWLPMDCWCVVAPDLEDQLTVLADSGVVPELGPGLYRLAWWVIEHDQAATSGDLRQDPRIERGAAVAALAFPLRGRDRVAGALLGFDRGVSPVPPSFRPATSRAIELLLRPAAAALNAALLLKRTEALSVTDDLTRLHNSRYLNQVLRRESKLAGRTGRALSLLFIDLDGFKSINDSHGHLAGSRALVEVAAVIRGSARETDVVARFGGDEFALVLPDTGRPGALAVAERVRSRLAAHRFLTGDGLDIHITASIGVATLPDVAHTADELVQAADAAMYKIKDRGKNGILAAARSR